MYTGAPTLRHTRYEEKKKVVVYSPIHSRGYSDKPFIGNGGGMDGVVEASNKAVWQA